jgi:predicted nucleic-acid-binding Zn-ribbon protein
MSTPPTAAPNTYAWVLCTNCGFAGYPQRIVPGSNFTGCLLLILFVIPGLIYAVWQQTQAGMGCPQCKRKEYIIPYHSERAQEIVAERGRHKP